MSFENENKKVMPAGAIKNLNIGNTEADTNKTPNKTVNNSGKGPSFPVPDGVKNRFNWGAFLLTWIWGLGNKTYITLLIFLAGFVCIIPIVGWLVVLGMQIWFGIKGNEWAWQNKKFESEEAFHNYQKKWTIAGVAISVIGIIITAVLYAAVFAIIFSSPNDMKEHYQDNIENIDTYSSEYEKEYENEMKKLDADLAKSQKEYEEQMKKLDAVLKEMEQKQ